MTLHEVINTTNKELQKRFESGTYTSVLDARILLYEALGDSDLKNFIPYIPDRGVTYAFETDVLEFKAKRKKIHTHGRHTALSYVSYEIIIDTENLAGIDIKKIVEALRAKRIARSENIKASENKEKQEFEDILSGHDVSVEDFFKMFDAFKLLSGESKRALRGES